MDRIKETLLEVLYATLPVTLVILVLKFTIAWISVEMLLRFLLGVFLVIGGLALFLLGVKVGLLPMGELMGVALMKTGKVWLIFLFALLLGFVITVAEPPVRILATQVESVAGGGISHNLLIYSIALGVAISLGLALLRTVYRVPLPYLLVTGYLLIFIFASFSPAIFVPIAFDSGGVTTGPMTVPFILALGVGVAAFFREDKTSTDGFGLVALASIGPILAVLMLGLAYR